MYACAQDQGRHNYVTPTSYLELITSFQTLLGAKRAQVRGWLVGVCSLEPLELAVYYMFS